MAKFRLVSLITLFIVLVTLSVFVGYTNSAPVPAKEIELRFASYVGQTTTPGAKVIEPWSKLVEKATNGKVKITIYPSETLCKMADTPNAITTGIADIALGLGGVPPGRFPMSDVLYLPFSPWGISSELSSLVQQRMYAEGGLGKEWSDMKQLFFLSISPARLFTRKPVRSLADFKGLKLASNSTIVSKTVEALGATALNIPQPDYYISHQTGVVDGFTAPWEFCATRKMYEVVNYVTDYPIFVAYFYYVMNLNKWNSLPPDVQKAIANISGMWAAKEYGPVGDISDQKAKAEIVTPKLREVIKLSPDEQEKWRKATEPVWSWWIDDANKKGLPGKELVDAAFRITEAVEKGK